MVGGRKSTTSKNSAFGSCAGSTRAAPYALDPDARILLFLVATPGVTTDTGIGSYIRGAGESEKGACLL